MNLFESSQENEKIQKIRHKRANIIYKCSVSLKLKGHLIAKGLLKKLYYNLSKYDVIDFDIIYLKIGENNIDESIIYLDLFADNNEILSIFLVEVKNNCTQNYCNYNIINNKIIESGPLTCKDLDSDANNKYVNINLY